VISRDWEEQKDRKKLREVPKHREEEFYSIIINYWLKQPMSRVLVVHACNHSYLGSRDQED
jgi:hypothetical protein